MSGKVPFGISQDMVRLPFVHPLIAITLALTCTLVFAGQCHAAPKQEAQRHYEEGSRLYSAGRYEESIRELKTANHIDPAWKLPFLLLGRIYDERHQPKDSWTAYRSAVNLDPNDSGAWCNVASAYYKIGDKDDAVNTYRETLKRFPEMKSLHRNIGDILKEQGKTKEADEELSQAPSDGSAPAHVAAKSTETTTDSQKSSTIPTDLDSLPDEDTIPFQKNKFGHSVVNAQINGHSLEMMFDTGANYCSVGHNHLKACGIDPSTLKGKTAMVGGSGGGAVRCTVVPMTLKLGKTSRTVDVFVQPFMPTPPLVGVNFLAGLQYEVNNQLQVVRLRKKSAVARTASNDRYDPRDRNAVPFTMIGKSIVVPVQVCGKDVSMIFDTGCNGIAFPARIWSQLKVNAKFVGMGASNGIDGTRACYFYNVDRIDFGPVALKDVRVMVSNPGPPLPLLGQSVLGGEKFVIDESAKAIRFHR